MRVLISLSRHNEKLCHPLPVWCLLARLSSTLDMHAQHLAIFLLLGQVVTPTTTVQPSTVYFNESEFRARVDSALQKVCKQFPGLIVELRP